MGAPALLRGVDLAVFAVALVARLRSAGVAVSADGPALFVQAMRRLAPDSGGRLYWAARLTLVARADDLPAFDAVFHAVFADTTLGLDPPSLHRAPAGAPVTPVPAGTGAGPPTEAAGLPWTTRPATVRAAAETGPDSEDSTAIPDVLPSRIVARADEPFEEFDPDDLRLLGQWLEQAVAHWPRRRSMRREVHRHGKRIDLRETMRISRTTGWETVRLARSRQRMRDRRVVLICDVSRSMQPYTTIYLHLMRATAMRQSGLRPEVFAFSTSLTRLTPVLAHRSPEVARDRANAKVVDRYGGTHLGRSLAELLRSPHGNALRGAVVIIASDGWDSDPPELLARELARLRRRAQRLVWLNPRAGQPGFAPRTGSMAAALPYCDAVLPAHSLTALREMFAVLVGLR